jgi:hypothetical protein
MKKRKRLIEVAGLTVILGLAVAAGCAIELLSPYVTSKWLAVGVVLLVCAPFGLAVLWVLKQVEALSRVRK